MKKKTPIVANDGYNRFERNCGTFKGRGGENPLLLTTLIQFAQKNKK
jgi:hypothetical protein